MLSRANTPRSRHPILYAYLYNIMCHVRVISVDGTVLTTCLAICVWGQGEGSREGRGHL